MTRAPVSDPAPRQAAALRALLQVILPRNAFYARKLAGCVLPGPEASLSELLAALPFTTKEDLVADQAAHPPYGSDLSFPLDQYTRFNQTSASSGKAPLRWLDTPASWQGLLDNWQVVYQAAGVQRGDRVFFAFSFGPFLGFWTAWEAALQLGCFCVPGGGLSTGARLQALLDHQITVLCCTPTYALRLGEVAAQEGVDLSQCQVRRLIVAGEPGGSIPATRRQLERYWPAAKIHDHHGMTEVGPVSYECPHQPGLLHLISEAYAAEVVDSASGQPLPPGATGELVLTTLTRVGSPLLRYRTGDLVKLAPADCPCGLPALHGGILGRADDMALVRGVNLYPSAVESILRGQPGLAEYRVELSTHQGMTEVSVQAEPAPDCAHPEALRDRLEALLRNSFHLRIPVQLVNPGALPRFELKARRWVRV
jgi:phenylacetate-CoA ligase